MRESRFDSLRSSSWVWLLGLFTAASFIEVAFWGQIGAFTPLYLPQLGITSPEEIRAWTGWSVTIATIIGLPFLPLWGALADRFARKPIIVRSYAAYLLSSVVTFLATNIFVFVFGRALMSMALGNTGLMMTTLSERTPPRRSGLSFAILNSAGQVGLFVGPLIGGPVVDNYGFRVLLGINVALMALIIVALVYGYTDRFRGTYQGSLLQMTFDSLRIIWRSPRLRALFPALFVLFAGWMLAFTYVPLVVAQIYHGTDVGTAVGWTLAAGGISTAVISPALGALSDRLGHWRTLFMSASLSVLLWPLPFFTRDPLTFALAWAAINGVTGGTFAISFSVLAESAATEVRGRVMTFSYLPVNVGYALGPALGSLVTRWSLFAVFPASCVLTVLGIAALTFAARRQVAPAPGLAQVR